VLKMYRVEETGEFCRSLGSRQPAVTKSSLKDLSETDGYSRANRTVNEVCIKDLQ
jgi:hypothetical protein